MSDDLAAQQPLRSSFRYLLIPSDSQRPVESLVHPETATDEDLRATITQHFRSHQLSLGQREEMKRSLAEKAAANAQKQGGDDAPHATSMLAYAEGFVDQTSYEIVPVVMPTRSTNFIGTSLYIDDAGRFKEMPLNERASKICQRDIRGDAFLLSNHDDPALDVWERVDCTEEVFHALLANPPTTQLDTSNQAAMSSATMLRENDAKKISVEDAARGVQAKGDGNAFFGAGDYAAAVQAYSEAIDLLEGRRDLHDNADELEKTRTTSVLNRALCYAKLGRWHESLVDAKVSVELDPGNAKAYFRLAAARAALKEYDESLDAIKACEMTCGVTSETQRLRQEVLAAKSTFHAEEKSKFSKMFR